MNQDIPEEIIVEQRGSLALITLNRPRALNALSFEMIVTLRDALRRFRSDDSVRAIMVRGAGDRAFCAGGDIKSFYEYGMKYHRGEVGMDVPAGYFAQEYSMNLEIYHYPKPIISFMNGITMGGGYGIAGNCRLRVVTDKTVFAMPEVGIGFFPDVGSVYHLLRFKNNIGRYLALTGAVVSAHDAFYAGAGEYFMSVDREADLIRALQDGGDAETVLDRFCDLSCAKGELFDYVSEIEQVFLAISVDEIVNSLAGIGSEWAQNALQMMQMKSPSSIAVTAEYLRLAQGRDIDWVLAQDFNLAQKFIEGGDLYEGIRAAVIDRTHKPEWKPAALKDVSLEYVNEYFKPALYDLKEMSA